MALELGIWDHFERIADVPAARQFDERIALVQRAEELGFYGYHVAEHHLSPLSMAPSPLMFLGALARATTRIRLGSMIAILPLYPPIRLAQEICMVDAISNGRLEFGVGRGIRDVEHEWYGYDPAHTRDVYAAALEQIRSALMTGKVEVEVPGGGHTLAPFLHEPTQRPTPPFWYVGNLEYAAEQGMSVLAHAPDRDKVATYWSAWEAQRSAGNPLHQGRRPLIGATRPVYVAETDEKAEAVARRAWSVLGDHFWATDTRVAGRAFERGAGFGPGGDVAEARYHGGVLYGTPDHVRDVLSEFLENAGPDFGYLVSGFQWGDITQEEALASLELFTAEVAPALRERHASL